MLKITIALIAVLAVVSASSPSEQFELFEQTYNKQYATAEEREFRKQVFAKVRLINESSWWRRDLYISMLIARFSQLSRHRHFPHMFRHLPALMS